MIALFFVVGVEHIPFSRFLDLCLYHHILDPSTGYPIENNLNQVTIISDKSVDGDALSTTCYALGLDEGLKLIRSMDNIEAVFITDDNTIYKSSDSVDLITDINN